MNDEIDFNEQSDRDLNIAAACKLGYLIDYNATTGSAICIIDGSLGLCARIVDFCNDDGSFMPAVVKYQISLEPRRLSPKLPWMASLNDRCYGIDKKPMRAAVICFLIADELDLSLRDKS